MVSRDYTKELGLKSSTRKVPWPIAAVILAGIGGLVYIGVATMNTGTRTDSAHFNDAAKPAAAKAGTEPGAN